MAKKRIPNYLHPFLQHRPGICDKYVRYTETNIKPRCSRVYMRYDDNQPCNCGLDELLGIYDDDACAMSVGGILHQDLKPKKKR